MTKEQQNRLFIISGPSGAGKTTIYKRIFTEHSDLNFSVSVTTRKARPGEKEGADYYFVSKEEFETLRINNRFAEWADVHGNYYGTLKSEIEKKTSQGMICLLDVDVQGADSLRSVYPDANYIFIIPPSKDELRKRLLKRGSEKDEEQQLRLLNAEKELEQQDKFDYVIMNKNFDEAYRQVEQLLFKEEPN